MKFNLLFTAKKSDVLLKSKSFLFDSYSFVLTFLEPMLPMHVFGIVTLDVGLETFRDLL